MKIDWDKRREELFDYYSSLTCFLETWVVEQITDEVLSLEQRVEELEGEIKSLKKSR